MKVLSIHWGLSLGGVAKYAVALEGLRECYPVEWRSACILPAGRVVDEGALAILNPVLKRVRGVGDLSWLPWIRRLIQAERPDCIMSHGFNGHFVSWLGGPADGPKRLASYHGGYHAPTGMRRLVQPFYDGFTHWFFKRRAVGILNVAEHCAEHLARRGVPVGKLTVVHNGIPDVDVPAEARGRLRREWGLDDRHLVIGVASRLDPVKGLGYLLDAFAGLAAGYDHLRLVMLGDGTIRDELEARARTAGVGERVVFTGRRADVAECLTAFDVFALPSLAEYHSIGLLEAMRAGRPIVATDVGGNTESVRHRQEALVVPPADTAALRDALSQLVVDASLRAELGANARQRYVAEFGEDVMLRRTAEWLRRACCG